ncbi:unnamed protein product [Amoebophrya sp. A25]|nr:unnamed protein product [Amoebophrya sp. A25]|eukprot:GSA25T00018502001.1
MGNNEGIKPSTTEEQVTAAVEEDDKEPSKPPTATETTRPRLSLASAMSKAGAIRGGNIQIAGIEKASDTRRKSLSTLNVGGPQQAQLKKEEDAVEMKDNAVVSNQEERESSNSMTKFLEQGPVIAPPITTTSAPEGKKSVDKKAGEDPDAGDETEAETEESDTEADDATLLGEDWEIFWMGDRPFYHHRGMRVTQWEKPTLKQLKSGVKKKQEPLPVMKYREKITSHVRENRVTIICGETGCGKTTQVPQFLMDDPKIVPKGKYVIVTQPRKIAAITNSERIATERGHSVVGGEVGYQIRYHNKTDDITTRLVFCTTAVVLRRLFEDPALRRCAVLIIDEVHERDIHSEFLLTTIKDKLLANNMDIKLVLMTATFAGSTFVPFFKPLRVQHGDRDPESVLMFEGRCFPIKEYFLEDALEWTDCQLANPEKLGAVTTFQLQEIDEKLYAADDTKTYSEQTLRSLVIDDAKWVSFEKRRLIVDMVRKIDSDARQMIKGENGRGSVLIFLPGWRDITDLGEDLFKSETKDDRGTVIEAQRKYHILPLHSQLIPEEQVRVFDPAPPGRRKIILSTNIAETSVTISDIVYVMNTGIAKEMVYDSQRNTGVLEGQLISRANNTQRKGRAGRCQEGICIHLFPQYMLHTMKDYQFPEILSNSLEEHILQEMCLKLGDPVEFFKRTVSVPPEDRVQSGIEILENLGAIELNEFNKYQLTDLGQWLGNVPQHPCATLAMSYSAVFGVLMPVLAALSFMGQKSPFDIKKETKGTLEGGRGVLGDRYNSDHAALVNAFLGYKHASYLTEEQKLCDRDRADAGKRAAMYFEKHGLVKELVSGADQNVKAYLNLMVKDRGYNAEDCAYRLISPFWTVQKALSEDRFLLFKLSLALGYCPRFAMLRGSSFVNDQMQELKMSNQSVNSKMSWRIQREEGKLLAAEQENPEITKAYLSNAENNSDPLLLNMNFAGEGITYKRQSSSPYFALYTEELISFAQNRPLQMGETSIVNVNTVLLASRNFEYEGNQVQFDGWTGFVQDTEALEEIKELRKAIRLAMQKAIYNGCMFSVAGHATILPVLEFLKRDLRVEDIKGVRSPRASQKDLDSVMLRDLPLDVTQFQIRDLFDAEEEVGDDDGEGDAGDGKGNDAEGESGEQEKRRDKKMKKLFKVESLNIPMNPKTGVGRGFAFVQFDSRETAKKVVGRRDWRLRGNRVNVKMVVEVDPVRDVIPQLVNNPTSTTSSTNTNQNHYSSSFNNNY